MLNQIVVVGRLVKEPELIKTENDRNVTNITLAVPRSYKNENGEYKTDFIDCTLWNNVAETTTEYCKKGDLIGIKGRLQSSTYEDEGKTVKRMQVIGEKVTFLSPAKSKEKDEDVEIEKNI